MRKNSLLIVLIGQILIQLCCQLIAFGQQETITINDPINMLFLNVAKYSKEISEKLVKYNDMGIKRSNFRMKVI